MNLYKEPSVKIGKYTIYSPTDNLFWIKITDSEGGQFTLEQLEAMLAKFFDEQL